MSRVLLLGGTGAARRLAARLTAEGHEVTVSLAGVTTAPAAYPCAVRIGGFGGVAGLIRHLRDTRPDAVVDATHPFAAGISANAAEAAAAVGAPLYRLARPQWTPRAGERWVDAADLAAAVAAPPVGARAFFATGRSTLPLLTARVDIWAALRVVDPPTAPFPGAGRYVVARPPFDEASERALFVALAITHLVVKNAGGAAGRTKIAAAASLDLPVIVVRRPPAPGVASAVDEILNAIGS